MKSSGSFGQRLGLLFVGLILAALTFAMVENWRGERAWTAAKAKLIAAGLPLTPPPPPPLPPEEENFAQTPALRRITSELAANRPSPWAFPPDVPARAGHEMPPAVHEAATSIDGADLIPLGVWFLPEANPAPASQRAAAEAIAVNWQPVAADFAELLAAARQRPAGVLANAGAMGDHSQIDGWITLAQNLALRCRVLAAAGRVDEALDGLEIAVRMSRTCIEGATGLPFHVAGHAIAATAGAALGSAVVLRGADSAQLARCDELLVKLASMRSLTAC